MKKLIPVVIMMLLLLAGCVEYDEELWLKPNGSGRAKIRLSMESHYSNTEEILRVLSGPGIHLREYNLKNVGDNKKIYLVDFDFDNVNAFNNLDNEHISPNFFGQLNILPKDKDGKIVVKRKISIEEREVMEQLEGPLYMGDDLDMSEEEYIASLPEDDDLWMLYLRGKLENSTLKFKLHAPWKVIYAGDNSDSISPDGKTVTWKFNAKDLLNNTEVMTVAMKKGLNWLVYALIGLGLLLLVLFIFWIAKRSRK